MRHIILLPFGVRSNVLKVHMRGPVMRLIDSHEVHAHVSECANFVMLSSTSSARGVALARGTREDDEVVEWMRRFAGTFREGRMRRASLAACTRAAYKTMGRRRSPCTRGWPFW